MKTIRGDHAHEPRGRVFSADYEHDAPPPADSTSGIVSGAAPSSVTRAAIGLLWAGVTEDTDALLFVRHIGMFPSMPAVMLLRLDEYTGHGAHAHAAA